jgi:sortase A
MGKVIPVLSKGMLTLGAILILSGLGWGIWTRLNAPPDPIISDAGAVVLAVTAPLPPTVTPIPTVTPTTTPTVTPTHPPTSSSIRPGETVSPSAEPTETTPPTPTPTPSPTPTPTPAPTRPPQAEKPPTRIVAPSIEMDAKVAPMSWEMIEENGTMQAEWVVPTRAAGWHVNSSLPGHYGNVVLSGHHNIEGKVFRYVVDLDPGDEITLYVGDVPYVYAVTEKYILKEAGMPLKVRQKNAQWIMPTMDERLTLVTCWPYEYPGNSHRVIVVAKPPLYGPPTDRGQD